MMKAVRRVIQSTVLEKEEEERKKDGTVMAFFLACEELTKSTQWINDIDILSSNSSANIRQQSLRLFDFDVLERV